MVLCCLDVCVQKESKQCYDSGRAVGRGGAEGAAAPSTKKKREEEEGRGREKERRKRKEDSKEEGS